MVRNQHKDNAEREQACNPQTSLICGRKLAGPSHLVPRGNILRLERIKTHIQNGRKQDQAVRRGWD
jgi:hypothetical protein